MLNKLAEAIGVYWLIVKDGDPRVSAMYKRHYSCNKYRDGRRNQTQYRNRHLVMGPGEKLVLLSADCRAILGWRKFIDKSGQEGVNCAFFRNEGAFNREVLSSDLILAAERLAWAKWPGERLYTYVDAETTRKRRSKHKPPGACFVHADWTVLDVRTVSKELVILEKWPLEVMVERFPSADIKINM